MCFLPLIPVLGDGLWPHWFSTSPKLGPEWGSPIQDPFACLGHPRALWALTQLLRPWFVGLLIICFPSLLWALLIFCAQPP